MVCFGWLVSWFYGVSTLFGSFNAELRHFDKSFKQLSSAKVHGLNAKNSSISNNSVQHKYTVLFYLTNR